MITGTMKNGSSSSAISQQKRAEVDKRHVTKDGAERFRDLSSG